MAGLVPAIHVFGSCGGEDVDARDKRGHDGTDYPAATSDKENPAIRL